MCAKSLHPIYNLLTLTATHHIAQHTHNLASPTLTLPTDGKPISATRASPLFITSNPSPFSPFLPCGSNSCERYLASLAFSTPRWYSVAVLGREAGIKGVDVRYVVDKGDVWGVGLAVNMWSVGWVWVNIHKITTAEHHYTAPSYGSYWYSVVWK